MLHGETDAWKWKDWKTTCIETLLKPLILSWYFSLISIGNIGYASFFGNILWPVLLFVSLAWVCIVYMVYIIAWVPQLYSCLRFLSCNLIGLHNLMQSPQLVYRELSRPLLIENVWSSLVYVDLRQGGNVWGNCY